jgi:hypothetical protein
MLHDDIRRILIEDLRWRRPQLLVELRQRAWRHYRRRMRETPAAAWIIADELHLSGNDLVQAMVSQPSEPRLAWVERAGPADWATIRGILDAFTSQASTVDDAPAPEEVDPEFVEAILADPAVRVTMVHERDAGLTGYAFVLPLTRGTLDLLPMDGGFRRLVEATCSANEIADLRDDSEDATTFIFSTIVHAADLNSEASGALVRDVLPALLAGGKYLACTGSARYAAVLDAFGFAKVSSGLGPSAFDRDRQLDAFALDLRFVGAETWIDSIVTGRSLPRQLAVDDVTHEVQVALLHWRDDAKLEASPLAALAERRDPDSDAGAADQVRNLIRDGLARARAGASEDRELAFRALELAYMEHGISHERVAERLSVSRSTFYRLLKRAVAGVVAAIGRS